MPKTLLEVPRVKRWTARDHCVCIPGIVGMVPLIEIIRLNKMIPELRTAARVICQRLRHRPYQRGVTITAWDAIIDQLLDGRRYGAFSWHNAVEKEVRGYIAELDTETKQKIWESTEDAEMFPNASIDLITDCLYPHIFQATEPRIHRVVIIRERRKNTTFGHPEF